jgi:hypothetical protein
MFKILVAELLGGCFGIGLGALILYFKIKK